MKTQVIRITGLVWLCAGLWLSVWAIAKAAPIQVLPALVAAGFAVFGALAGYSTLRGRRWGFWAMFVQASFLAALGIAYFAKWGFGWSHGSGDWSALAATLFSALTLAALTVARLHERAA